MSSVRISITIEAGLLDRLDEVAHANFCSRSDYIRTVLVKNLGERDRQMAAETLKAQVDDLDLSDYKTPPSKTALTNFLAKYGVTKITKEGIGFHAVYNPRTSDYMRGQCQVAFSQLFGELVFLTD